MTIVLDIKVLEQMFTFSLSRIPPINSKLPDVRRKHVPGKD